MQPLNHLVRQLDLRALDHAPPATCYPASIVNLTAAAQVPEVSLSPGWLGACLVQ